LTAELPTKFEMLINPQYRQIAGDWSFPAAPRPRRWGDRV